MRFSFPFILTILGLFLLFSLAAARLAGRLHPFYRRPPVQILYAGLSYAAVGALILSRWLRPGGMAAVLFNLALYGAYAWLMGQIILLLVGLPVWSATTTARKVFPPHTGETESRLSRRQLLQGALAAVPVLAIGFSTRTVYAASTELAVRRFTLPLMGLPPSLAGYKIVQISDTHLGPFFSLNRLELVLSLAQREQPDLVAITGDLVDDLTLLTPAVERLSSLVPHVRHGLYFCWGNHEYFRDIGQIRRVLAASPIKLLENSHVRLAVAERPFYLAGVDYPWANSGAAQAKKRRSFTAQALEGIPPAGFTILLAHHPDFLEDGFAHGLPLTLAGHTHGGQVVMAGQSLLPVRYRYMRGLYQMADHYGYVNSGAGSWFPFRLNCPPEIAVFTLVPGGSLLPDDGGTR